MTARTILPATAERPADEAVDGPGGTRTWEQLETNARRLANGLREYGVSPGERFAILSRNRVEWPELLLGNVRNRSRYVPVNWHLTEGEIADLLVDSGAQLLLVGPGEAAAGRAAAATAGVATVIELGDEYDDWLTGLSDDPLEDGPMGTPLLYTGGTTGRSKGVTRSDMGLPVSGFSLLGAGFAGHLHMPPAGRTLLTTPAYHALAFGLLQAALGLGHHITLLERFDPVETLEVIGEQRITATAMVPTQFVRLLKLPDDVRAAADVSSVEWIMHTAAPCPRWAKEAMIEWFGPVVVELYGSSEGTGPVVCTSEEWLARPGTVGRAAPMLTLSIVGDDGSDLPPGEIGTVYVKRNDGAPEYHDDPTKTQSIRLPDGRFTVGDLGWLDDDGYLFLADRRVDLILRGGVNVYPAEIEAVLLQHPSVADVAVFGIPDDDLGQQIKAVVEPAPGADRTTLAVDLRAFAVGRMAAFKVPASIDIVDALPREASGKLLKRLLRDPYWVDHDRS